MGITYVVKNLIIKIFIISSLTATQTKLECFRPGNIYFRILANPIKHDLWTIPLIITENKLDCIALGIYFLNNLAYLVSLPVAKKIYL